MNSRIMPANAEAKRHWTNEKLVRSCLKGEEAGWDAFLEQFKNLIYSIPIKYGFSSDDAADIFQAVCMEVLVELPKLREPNALPKWLIQMTSHKCFHWKRQQQRFVSSDSEHATDTAEDWSPLADELLAEVEQEQLLRESIASLPERCRQLVGMLFFDSNQRPYAEVARMLGLATGSIGFIRQRCLNKLRRRLLEEGFRH
jgi:RNA polymerase sigma factor (sigma-70 family)